MCIGKMRNAVFEKKKIQEKQYWIIAKQFDFRFYGQQIGKHHHAYVQTTMLILCEIKRVDSLAWQWMIRFLFIYNQASFLLWIVHDWILAAASEFISFISVSRTHTRHDQKRTMNNYLCKIIYIHAQHFTIGDFSANFSTMSNC